MSNIHNIQLGQSRKISYTPFNLRVLSGEYPGNNFYVDGGTGKGGVDGGGAGTFENPFATVDFAIGQCTATNGDVIWVKPGHTETTTAIALDVAGVSIVGLGVGGAKPTLTATTAATDLINVSADNCWIENLRLVGAASGVTAILDVAADDFTFVGNDILVGAAPLDIVTIASGDRGRILGNTFIGTAANPDNAIMAQSRTLDWQICGNLFNFLEFDIDENIIDAPANAIPGWVILDNEMLGMAVVALTIKCSVANKFAFMERNTLVAHAAVTIVELLGTTIEGMFFGAQNYAVDTTKTERAVNVPKTTAA